MSELKIYTANRNKTGREVWVNGLRLDPFYSQKLRDHSPDGFEWGYGGSGPSQLALAILLDVIGNGSEALKHYQQFKWDFIARADQNGFVITSLEVEAWYNAAKDSDANG